MNRFETLAAINCNDKTEKKNGLTYLSWAWAWDQLKRVYPDSFYTIYEDANGCLYHTDGRTCWVKTGVTLVDGDTRIEHIEYLPIMDFKNRSIPLDQVTSMDANKAVQRSLTKAVARHGLGLYIYAGEDLPEEEKRTEPTTCADCGGEINDAVKRGGEPWYASDIAAYARMRYKRPLCIECMKKAEGR